MRPLDKIINFIQGYEMPEYDDKYFEDTYKVSDIGFKGIREAVKEMLVNNNIEIVQK